MMSFIFIYSENLYIKILFELHSKSNETFKLKKARTASSSFNINDNLIIDESRSDII